MNAVTVWAYIGNGDSSDCTNIPLLKIPYYVCIFIARENIRAKSIKGLCLS